MELKDIKFDEKGLCVAIAQDCITGEVLMQAFMNKEALQLSIETGYAHYYSRSRKSLWKKGETSGNVQKIVSISGDCDGDSILMKVVQTGVACHTGNRSCFFNELDKFDETNGAEILFKIKDIVKERRNNPEEGSYTNYLFNKGVDKICKKVGEEAAEVIIAAKNNVVEEMVYEISDLIYHIIVLMENQGVQCEDIFNELNRRHTSPRRDNKY